LVSEFGGVDLMERVWRSEFGGAASHTWWSISDESFQQRSLRGRSRHTHA